MGGDVGSAKKGEGRQRSHKSRCMELSEMCPITAEITTVSPAWVIHNLILYLLE